MAWLFAIATLLALMFGCIFIKIVPYKHTMIIERLGKFHCQCRPGVYIVVPFLDKVRKIDWCYTEAALKGNSVSSIQIHKNSEVVDLREKVLDFDQQPVITKDLASVFIDAVLYYRIIDPRLAVLRVVNLPYQLQLLTQATLRDIMAELTLDDSLSSRDFINMKLLEHLQNDCLRFGVTITRVELQNLLMNNVMTDAMTKQLIAERKRRSIVLLADGDRQQNVLNSVASATVSIIDAEAAKQVKIATSTADAKIRTITAQADAEALAGVKAALEEAGSKLTAVEYMLKMRYMSELSRRKFKNVVLVHEDALDGVAGLEKK